MRDTWTQQRIDDLRARWMRGEKAGKIALHLGIAETNLRKARVRFGLPQRSSRMFWTDTEDGILRDHWFSHSATVIGSLLSRTRNTVLGRAFRLGLPRKERDETGQAKPRVRKPRVMVRKNISPRRIAIFQAPNEVTPWGVTFEELTQTMCRWPVAESIPQKDILGFEHSTVTHFCGNALADGFPYCPGHARIAYRIPGRGRDWYSPALRSEAAALRKEASPLVRAA